MKSHKILALSSLLLIAFSVFVALFFGHLVLRRYGPEHYLFFLTWFLTVASYTGAHFDSAAVVWVLLAFNAFFLLKCKLFHLIPSNFSRKIFALMQVEDGKMILMGY